ncbi:oxygen-independent coproporphyrinogen III oxidase [Granulosicoccaceae sp. 1_MG-2023]|nr:oxygen-independent coproporphyrinogen III oxidase [Granulosicoccaceae sp. 1_MG-2023]
MTRLQFDPELIKRYDKAGPRYTSYPTAVSFTPEFTVADYRQHAALSHERGDSAPLSLYFHIPFCDTVCFYCACNKIATKDYSKADTYLDYLYREIDMHAALYDRSRTVEQLHFGGGTPTFLSVSQMRALMEKIRSAFTLLDGDQGEYSIEIDPRSVTDETIAALRGMGFNRFSLGVQDVNEQVQKAVNRIQPLSMSRDIIEACRRHGAGSVSVDLIYGLPFQTVESFTTTLDEIIRLSPDRLSVFNYAHLPTLFKPQRRINEADLPAAEVKLQILDLTIAKLTGAGYEYIGMDHFAKPQDELAQAQKNGTLHRNFQGYTTHAECDLVAMGVSAISSVADCYAQNEKELDAYYARIDAGEIPITRGLSLTRDDVIRREVIQELACHFRLDFAALGERLGLDFASYFAPELSDGMKHLIDDGLVRLTSDDLQVLPAGRFLIRNICMVFDRRLREQKEQRFSRVI